MRFNQFAGTVLMPTLARIVLCAAFLPQGYVKLFSDAEYTGPQVEKLREWEVIGPAQANSSSPPAMVTATLAPEENGDGAQPSADEAASDEADPSDSNQPANGDDGLAADEQAEPESESEPAPEEETAAPDEQDQARPTEAPTAEARRLYKVALLVDSVGWPRPVLMAWVAALTEFLGGALLLIGLFSRIWGLGLSIAMGVAFYLTSMNAAGLPGGVNVFDVHPFDFAQNTTAFNTMFSQIGLLFCALLILLASAGPLSIERVLFGRRRGTDELHDGMD